MSSPLLSPLHNNTTPPNTQQSNPLDLFNAIKYELFVKIAIIALYLQHHTKNNPNEDYSEIVITTKTFNLVYNTLSLLYGGIDKISFSYLFLALILLFKSGIDISLEEFTPIFSYLGFEIDSSHIIEFLRIFAEHAFEELLEAVKLQKELLQKVLISTGTLRQSSKIPNPRQLGLPPRRATGGSRKTYRKSKSNKKIILKLKPNKKTLINLKFKSRQKINKRKNKTSKTKRYNQTGGFIQAFVGFIMMCLNIITPISSLSTQRRPPIVTALILGFITLLFFLSAFSICNNVNRLMTPFINYNNDNPFENALLDLSTGTQHLTLGHNELTNALKSIIPMGLTVGTIISTVLGVSVTEPSTSTTIRDAIDEIIRSPNFNELVVKLQETAKVMENQASAHVANTPNIPRIFDDSTFEVWKFLSSVASAAEQTDNRVGDILYNMANSGQIFDYISKETLDTFMLHFNRIQQDLNTGITTVLTQRMTEVDRSVFGIRVGAIVMVACSYWLFFHLQKSVESARRRNAQGTPLRRIEGVLSAIGNAPPSSAMLTTITGSPPPRTATMSPRAASPRAASPPPTHG